MIIDAHSHGFHGKYLDQLEAVGGDWVKQNLRKATATAKNKPWYLDITRRVSLLDKYGIDYQVVTPAHQFDSNLLPGNIAAQLAYAAKLNDIMARLMEDSKGRLIAAATIPMAEFEEYGLKEMERAVNVLGLKAINVSSNLKGKPIDLPEFEPFWNQADLMSVPVYIHPCGPVGTADRSYEAEYDLIHNFGWPYETTLMLSRLVFSGIMERCPTLKVISHHLGGGMIPFYWGRILETYEAENQKQNYGGQAQSLPKPLFDYFSRFYYDTTVGGSASAIKCAYEVFGADALIFATDAPWGPGSGEFRLAEYPKVIKSLGLPEEDEKKIFEGNARIALNLT